MVSKETFCKALRLIKEQQNIDHQFSKALELVGDGHYVFSGGEKLLEALRLVLKEAACDKYEYIEWWLYDATSDYQVWTDNKRKQWCLKEPEALYDFIRTECQD